MSSLLVLIPMAVALGFTVRWMRSRRDLDLADALDVPWWQWLPSRIAIIRYQVREAHADLWRHTGMHTGTGDDAVPYPAWRCVVIDRHNGTWRVRIRVKRGFLQGDGVEDVRAQQAVVNNARGTLALGRVHVKWHFQGRLSHVAITPEKLLPKKAPFVAPNIRRRLEAALTERPTIGAISSKCMPNISCSTNARRSAGSNVSRTTSNARPTESASTASCSGLISSW